MNNLPEAVVRAIKSTDWLKSVPRERIVLITLHHDWVVSIADPSETLVAGGLRLVIPKRGGNAISISSGANANETGGVSAIYEVIVRASVKPFPADAVRVLADELDQRVDRASEGKWTTLTDGARRIEVLRSLRDPPSVLGTFHVSEPLALQRKLKAMGIRIALIRPDDCGGYEDETSLPFENL